MRKIARQIAPWALGLAACLAIGTAAYASVTFDPVTGVGFVGKGDVQYTFGLNNQQVQTLALAGLIAFQAESLVQTDVTWDCLNSNNDKIQQRQRTTTTNTVGVLDTVARTRNQVTGFLLQGYIGVPTTTSSTSGPGLHTCPNGPSWSYVSGSDATTTSSSSSLQVSEDGGNTFVPLEENPL